MSPSPRTPPSYVSKDPLVVDTSDVLGVGVDNLALQAEGVALTTGKDVQKKIGPAVGMDPLLIAATIASSTGMTRHHHHLFRPSVRASRSSEEDSSDDGTEDKLTPPSLSFSGSSSSYNSTPSLSRSPSVSPERGVAVDAAPSIHQTRGDAEVKCVVRTRIPTPHGPVFLHLYHNNRDNKEHLAIVVDPAQLADSPLLASPIRSRSLDAVWDENETDMDRILRGAYTGRLSETARNVSRPDSHTHIALPDLAGKIPAPLVRIHSECFTGETVGSLRCDCGEQLDEAIRRISQPTTITASSSRHDGTTETVTLPGRGAVVYMRQEGRGIGLLSKLRAYNLQDLGYDTVQANIMLGHGADERTYEVAAAILRDLGMGDGGEDVRLLTNNPDKVQALEGEGVAVIERVEMVPRAWKCQDENIKISSEDGPARAPGATMIGGGTTRSVELEKYLQTKVLRMGHLLSLPFPAVVE